MIRKYNKQALCIEQVLLIGVANKKALFVTSVDWSQVFTKFDWLVLTSRLDSYISRYGDFCANNNDNDNDTAN